MLLGAATLALAAAGAADAGRPGDQVLRGSVQSGDVGLAGYSVSVWVANCGNDSVTMIPDGDPDRAVNIQLGPTPVENRPELKPFGAAVDADGNVWIVTNRGNTVSVVSPDGRLLDTLPGTFAGKTVLSHPVANAADLEGNMWVTNSDWLDSPCPTRFQLGDAEHPSITPFREDTRTPYPGSPFTGGG